ncbi:MAG: Na/Pi cotransporter family protein [Oscillospiraceae bacterium]|nr:Na/Pi cotransporter family protein [Oscillospiraceae bacterium]
MDIFSILTLFGGLALFLYGMNEMGKGLEKLAGGKLEKIFEKLTSNRLKGLLLGVGVTALIQSSSATTVMLVGFVNSGIMKLAQAISIIMGANIGTTITSWLLSLSVIDGNSFWIKMLKPTSFSPVLAVIGIIFIMFVKDQKKKDIGSVFVGFAVLMFGMNTMSGAVAPLADSEKFTGILTMFSNPFLGVLAGAFLTAVIQSSSASVGILQALSSTGNLQFGAAIPIILGQNIGTCVTALMSSVGANKNAKRVAVVHLYFNLIGTAAFMILFYSISAFVDFSFMDSAVSAFGIAAVHTIFNIIATAILLPFSKLLEKLAYLTVKDDDTDEKIEVLDDRLLNTPAIAIEQCRSLTAKMGQLSMDTIGLAVSLCEKYEKKKAEKLLANEEQIDLYEDKIGAYLVKVSSRDLTDIDSKSVSKLLHIIGDFERISDHAVNIHDTALEMHEKNLKFTGEASKELKTITDAVKEVVSMSVNSFINNDSSLALMVEPLEEVVDDLRIEIRNRHINRLQTEKCTIEMGFIFSDYLTNLERVSDHCSNIALCMLQIINNNFDTHEYQHEMKSSGRNFDKQYEIFKVKYSV